MIEVSNLVKKYGDHVAVDDLSFKVEKGQIYGFLGPNGAGKTTTMNMITGYIASTQGKIVINGHDILEEPEEAKKSIGYLPESPPIYSDMTVMEYLKFAAELKEISKEKREQLINEAIAQMKLDEVKERLIKNLSKGYKQRVGFAQAILGYPEILILDEPTVGLDPKQIIEMRDLIKSLGEKHTVILSSHILSEISAICDYVMIIARGKLVASDTPENLGKMMNSNALEMTVRGTEKRIKTILEKIPDIQEIKTEHSQEEGAVDISVQTTDKTDVREEIFYTLAENKCPVLMMKSSNMTLEDIFLELTSDVPKPPIKRNKFFLFKEKMKLSELTKKEEEEHAGDL